jgi:hypothetical protein
LQGIVKKQDNDGRETQHHQGEEPEFFKEFPHFAFYKGSAEGQSNQNTQGLALLKLS